MKQCLIAAVIGLLFLLAANIERPNSDTIIFEYICDDGQIYSYEADTLIPEAEVCPQN